MHPPYLDTTGIRILSTPPVSGLENAAKAVEYKPTPVPTAARLSIPYHPPDRRVLELNAPPRFSGPIHARSYGSPVIDSISNPVTQLDGVLRKELKENILNTVDKFLYSLLPHKRLPFPVDQDLLSKLSVTFGTNTPIWNDHRSCFGQPPLIHLGEAAVCGWLNHIGRSMGLVYGRQCKRLWWSGFCEVPMEAKVEDLIYFQLHP